MQGHKPGQHTDAFETLSPWWLRSIVVVMLAGFSVLILLSAKVYDDAPPIPARTVTEDGALLFTAEDVADGQAVFLKYGLMNNGSVWGHGGMMGPDFSAQTLHNLGLSVADHIARERFATAYAELDEGRRGEVNGTVAATFKTNRYDPDSGTLTLPAGTAFETQRTYWTDYFDDPANNGGLARGAIREADELRQLTAFFVWTAWVSAAERPGESYSYTNNFPYDPLVGNNPTSATVLWSAVSLLFLLGGIGAVLLAFGKFNYLGWQTGAAEATASPPEAWPAATAPTPTPAQAATLQFMLVASLLFLVQSLLGSVLAHYRAEPDNFYGVDLSTLLPSNLLRGWHLQLAIFWIATCYVGGALFVASGLGGGDPKRQRPLIHVLFWGLVTVVVGSLLGQWAGINDRLGDIWFWFGNQGWEYLELGRAWQMLLAASLLFWFGLLFRAVWPAWHKRALRPFVALFLLSAVAIPVFYLPAFFFGARTHFSIVDVWRFWIIHLWVEGFFEFFLTVIVALIFYQLGIVRRLTALRVIYLDAILYFGGGLVGTAHHWYFTGQTPLAMALGASFSALEVVPLTLLTLDAWDFYKVAGGERQSGGFRHRWTFFFLMAVGFWNFVGAGVFGFLINLPIVSYYEVGTTLTANHGHAALIGVFGMLAVGLMTYVVTELASEEAWPRIVRCLRVAFWGLNGGLALMVVMSLLPAGLLQVWDVIENGYWHARSTAYSSGSLPSLLEWLRRPADLTFIFMGAVPLTWGVWLAMRDLRRGAASVRATSSMRGPERLMKQGQATLPRPLRQSSRWSCFSRVRRAAC